MPFRISGSGRETLPNVRECWGAFADVREASRKSGSGREALPDVREWSEAIPKCTGVVGRHTRMSGSGWRPSRMFGRGRETLPMTRSARVALPDVH